MSSHDVSVPHGAPPSRPLGLLNAAGEFYWQKVKTAGRCPAPRWHHTVAVRAPATLVLFGGFRSSSVRFNDLWLLDTKGDKWSQPQPGMTEEAEDGKSCLCTDALDPDCVRTSGINVAPFLDISQVVFLYVAVTEYAAGQLAVFGGQ